MRPPPDRVLRRLGRRRHDGVLGLPPTNPHNQGAARLGHFAHVEPGTAPAPDRSFLLFFPAASADSPPRGFFFRPHRRRLAATTACRRSARGACGPRRRSGASRTTGGSPRSSCASSTASASARARVKLRGRATGLPSPFSLRADGNITQLSPPLSPRAMLRCRREEEQALVGTTIPVEELSVVMYESRSLVRRCPSTLQPDSHIAQLSPPLWSDRTRCG